MKFEDSLINSDNNSTNTAVSLSEGEAKYRLIFENSLDAILLTSPDGIINAANPAACRLFQMNEEEIISCGREGLSDMNDPRIKKAVEEREQTGKFFGELSMRKKDGNIFPVEMSTSVFTDEKGLKLTCMIIRDITERKKREDELKKSELSFRSLTENSTDYVMRYDRECRHTFMNKAGLEVSGFTEKEIIGKTHLETGFPEELAREWEEKILRVFETGKADGWEFEWESTVGKKILDWRLMPERDEKGNIYSVLGISRDITDVILREEKIKASLKEKEVLLKEIHHRVKNNLQVISSLLSLQADTVNSSNYLEAFRDSRNRIRSMAIIHEKLYHSGNFASIDFREYASELIEYLRAAYGLNSRQVETVCDFDEIFLSIDTAIPLGLMFNEIISNAYKYAFKEKEKGLLHCSMKKMTSSLTLSIKDNGPGLNLKTDLRDTGTLGLTMVHSFITQLKGKVEIKNIGGTEFIITIPINE